ncbi:MULTISPECIES: Dabb family protein [unclassified Variovorax]|uniref:Dabb family protein n=1 Tax=unclassified Variovorax TaxID=663243 RepID=UPI002574EB58|nr:MULTISPECIES: Dabb family protein [unclassified Variovorax]MDM0066979.1 Dabb family protein [Variovorax sp. J31P207]MDM0084678.1 Dabb family protein [Variovorax sp. J31P179]
MKHVVMWRVAGASASERMANCLAIRDAFESLRGRVPGLLELEIGIDASRIDYACDVVLLTRFQDAQSLEDYATHPEHVRVKRELGELRIARHQVDYPLPKAL